MDFPPRASFLPFSFPRFLQPYKVWHFPLILSLAALRSTPWGKQPSIQKRAFDDVFPFVSATFAEHVSSPPVWRMLYAMHCKLSFQPPQERQAIPAQSFTTSSNAKPKSTTATSWRSTVRTWTSVCYLWVFYPPFIYFLRDINLASCEIGHFVLRGRIRFHRRHSGPTTT